MANINKKTFDVIVRTVKEFNVFLYGFAFATTLLFHIRNSIVIGYITQLITKWTVTFNLKRIRLIISKTSLIQKITQGISARTIKMTIAMRQRINLIAAVTQKHPILFSSKLRQKVFTTISNGVLSLVTSPVVASFFTLGDFDPQILGDLDPQTLGEMDYVEV